MGIFDGCLLVSDIDGTLMTNMQIPQRNIDAISYFKSEGGLFTIASGRMPDGIVRVHKQVGCNAPVLSANGGVLYDFETQKVLHTTHLSDRVKDIVDDLMPEFPSVGFIAINVGNHYVMQRNFGVELHRRHIGSPDFDALPEVCKKEDWVKLLMITNNALQTNVLNLFAQRAGLEDEVRFFRSDLTYLEMMDKRVNKGSGVKELLKHFKNIKRVYTIGDFDNDLELLAVGDISSAVAESPDFVKNAADIVSGPCAQGAVADFIEYLKQKHLSK